VSATALAPHKTATLTDRLLAAAPLASIYLWLCIVYAVEAGKRTTPWLFTDELEMTQIARSIAATGHPARRGVPFTFRSLYPVLTAPLWWIDDVGSAFSAIKFVDVLVMTSVVFPTYFLARLVLPRGWSLFAAAGAALIPSLAYSAWIVEETFAYPYAALCFLVVAKALLERTRSRIAVAAVVCAVAPAVKGELVVIPIMALFALGFAFWSGDWFRARRSSWRVSDYIGVVVVVTGVIIAVSGYASWHSQQWLEVTSYNWTKHRAFLYGNWAAGSLAIGLGVVPFVLGLASLVPYRREPRSLEIRIFRCTATAAVIAFALYTGMKAAYLSMHFGTRVEERNIMYISPLLFIGTALVLHRRRVSLPALAVCALYGFYLIVGTPYFMDRQLYSDALGLALMQQANRYYEWTPTTAQWVLLAAFLLGLALTAAAVLLRTRERFAAGAAIVVALGFLAWAGTGEIAAAAGSVSYSRETENSLRRPFSWVDEYAQGKPTLYLAQGVSDPIPEWLLEFWNRSISGVSSLDKTLGGPGPAQPPNLTAEGRIYWTEHPSEPGRTFDYAVEDWPCVELDGSLVTTHAYGSGTLQKSWRLVKLTQPNRMRAMCTGISADGWTSENDSTYYRFAQGERGFLRIRISRQDWPSTPVHIQLADVTTKDTDPALGRIRASVRIVVESGKPRTVWLPTPAGRFAVRVVVDKKFIPRDISDSTDPRTLGALVDYRFFRNKP